MLYQSQRNSEGIAAAKNITQRAFNSIGTEITHKFPNAKELKGPKIMLFFPEGGAGREGNRSYPNP